jgi:hypothetical protein
LRIRSSDAGECWPCFDIGTSGLLDFKTVEVRKSLGKSLQVAARTTTGHSKHPLSTCCKGNALNSQVKHVESDVDKASVSLDHSGVARSTPKPPLDFARVRNRLWTCPQGSPLSALRHSTQQATKGFWAQIGPPFCNRIHRNPPMPLRVAYRRVIGLNV